MLGRLRGRGEGRGRGLPVRDGLVDEGLQLVNLVLQLPPLLLRREVPIILTDLNLNKQTKITGALIY